MKVLIIKLSSIGDVAHTLPALSALRKGLDKGGGKAQIDWLVEEAASTILSGNPLIDNIIVVKRGWRKNYSANMKTARMLASNDYDMVLDFQGLLKSGIWVFLSRGKRKIGFSNAREFSHLFLNEKLPPYDVEKHAIERYLELAKYAGGDAKGIEFLLPVDKAARETATGLLKKNGLKADGYFVLIVRARWKTKLWSDEKFIELARKVVDKTGLKAVLAGGREDREGLEAIKNKIGKNAVNLAGSTDLKTLAEILRASSFVVTVDSGPMHIAAAAGAKVVALFGPTAPWRTGPYGEGHVIVRKGLKCSPCFRKTCSDLKCMDEITVEEVLEAVEGFIPNKA